MTDLPPYDPATSSMPTSTRPGELLDRFLARLIDGVIVGVAYAVVGVALIVGLLLGPVDSVFITGLVSVIVLVALQLGYFVYLDTTRGQTVGKMLLKLRVLGPQGGLPTVEESLRRNIWLAFGLAGIVPVVGSLLGGAAQIVAVIMIAVGINNDNVNRQAWHDQFAGGTRVVKEG